MVIKLIQNNSLRSQLSNKAIKWASQFDWEKSTSLLIGLLSTKMITEPVGKHLLLQLWDSFSSTNKNFKAMNHINVPEYQEIRKLSSSNKSTKYHVGLYSKGHDKFIIKSYIYKQKDYHYYNLIREAENSINLARALALSKTSKKLCTPAVVDILESKNTLSIVNQYIDNNKDEAITYKEIYDFVLPSLNQLNYSTLTKKQRSKVKRLSNYDLILGSLWLYIVGIITNSLRQAPFLTRVFVSSLYSLIQFDSKELVFAHRHLKPENIIKRGDRYYLLDLEHGVYTLTSYDLTLCKLLESISTNKKLILNSKEKKLIPYILLTKYSIPSVNRDGYLNIGRKYYES